MTPTVPSYRWTGDEFVRAWEAGAFNHRVELVRGELWPVLIGDWHGKTVGRIFRLLHRPDVLATAATLPSGDSLPDPDCWIQRAAAQRARAFGAGPVLSPSHAQRLSGSCQVRLGRLPAAAAMVDLSRGPLGSATCAVPRR